MKLPWGEWYIDCCTGVTSCTLLPKLNSALVHLWKELEFSRSNWTLPDHHLLLQNCKRSHSSPVTRRMGLYKPRSLKMETCRVLLLMLYITSPLKTRAADNLDENPIPLTSPVILGKGQLGTLPLEICACVKVILLFPHFTRSHALCPSETRLAAIQISALFYLTTSYRGMLTLTTCTSIMHPRPHAQPSTYPVS